MIIVKYKSLVVEAHGWLGPITLLSLVGNVAAIALAIGAL